MNAISLKVFEETLGTLEESLTPPPANDRERDGSIQRFEYTFEAAWRSTQKFLAREGVEASTPRDILRSAGKVGWIDDVEVWLQYLDIRIRTTHVYSKEQVDDFFKSIKIFPSFARALLVKLKSLSG
jgi:nucleotidyltransferase substrate binding protein (TIGR01987 family)